MAAAAAAAAAADDVFDYIVRVTFDSNILSKTSDLVEGMSWRVLFPAEL
jgi:hypothetical protein